MLTDIQAWMRLFEARLRETFPERIVFLGLQGSRGRGEEAADSDIDVVVVLDRLEPEDIGCYRAMLDALPERALVCGFLSGWEELRRWEPSDLFQFCHDTTPIIGSLDGLIQGIMPEDVARAARIGACNIYHGCVHTMCHGRSEAHLKELFKSAAFVLRALHYRRTGVYLRRSAELLPLLDSLDAQVLETAMRLKSGAPVAFGPMSELLFRWAQGVIAPSWRQIETDHFTLFYDERDAALAEALRCRVDEDFQRVSRDFDLRAPEGKFAFYLCPDVPTFMERAGKTPDAYETWMVGNTDYEERRLCVLSPRAVTDRPPEAVEKVITHEIVHIAMDALCPGDACPLWLGEGVAALYAGQVYVRSEEACPLISELEQDFVGHGGYDCAGAYVWYLLERCGVERFKRIYAGEEPVSAALYPGFERDAAAAWLSRTRVTANPAG